MKIALIVLLLASLPRIVQAQQASAIERISRLLAEETHCFAAETTAVQRQSMRILDSSQLSLPEVSFRLAGLQQTTRNQYLATVRCANSAECLPFLVAFRCHEPVGAEDRPQAVRQHKRGTAVHAGDRARLEITITGADLSFPVICLEEGDVGEIIRTRAPATNKIFQAMVVGPRQLRGVERAQ
jgi:hypothetical protein